MPTFQARLAGARKGLLALLVVASMWIGCDTAGGTTGGDLVGGVDLDALFAPVRPSEINQAFDAWAGREAPARDVELVLEDRLTHPFAPGWRAELRVYRHDVDGNAHYGAVITPAPDSEASDSASSDAGVLRPVLLYLHGGDAGVRMEDVALAMAITPEMREGYVVVVPSFRSEPLFVGDVAFSSEGEPSPWDRDVDDTIALLNVALETTPTADAERIVAVGFSRGGTVGLLASIRDERIRAVTSFFAPTDFLGAFAREVARDMLRGDLPDLPGVGTIKRTLLEPLQEGRVGMDEVRVDLIGRSPVYFAGRLPTVQIHHGLEDRIVPFQEGEALADALKAEGRTDYDAFFYEGGGHDPLTLNGALDRLKSFLRVWTNPPA